MFTARYGLDLYTEFKSISVSEGSVTGLDPRIKLCSECIQNLRGVQCPVGLLARRSSTLLHRTSKTTAREDVAFSDAAAACPMTHSPQLSLHVPYFFAAKNVTYH